MSAGRKYGLLAYGKYTYDLWPSWHPIPPSSGEGDVWVPVPDTSPVPPPPDIWATAPTPPPSEIWGPISVSPDDWSSTLVPPPTEIWVPVINPKYP
jgi:hypothetical protein